jgi:hypothetical protein
MKPRLGHPPLRPFLFFPFLSIPLGDFWVNEGGEEQGKARHNGKHEATFLASRLRFKFGAVWIGDVAAGIHDHNPCPTASMGPGWDQPHPRQGLGTVWAGPHPG